jgi:hypothetical protein
MNASPVSRKKEVR